MVDDVLCAASLLVDVGVRLEEAERAVFVDAAHAVGDCDGEDGNVHHDHQAELHCGVDVGEVEGRCAGVARGRGLEDCGEDARAHGESVDFGVFEVERDDEEHVDEVECDENARECPGCGAGEEESVAASWVVEQKAECFLLGHRRGCELVGCPDG